MSEQTSIAFVPVTPVAATGDPQTSHIAARQVKLLRKVQAQQVYAAVVRYPGRTSAELSALIYVDRHIPGRRLSELADPRNGGLIVRGESRVCRITGRLALTWRTRKGNV